MPILQMRKLSPKQVDLLTDTQLSGTELELKSGGLSAPSSTHRKGAQSSRGRGVVQNS